MSIFSSRQYKLIMLFVIVLCAAIVPACTPTQAQIDAAATANYPETEEYQATFAAAAVAQTVAAQAAVDVAVAQTIAAQAPTDLSQTGDIAQTAVITATNGVVGSPKSNSGAVDPAAPAPVDGAIPQLNIPNAINVRSGPGTAYKVVGSLPAGAVVNVIAKTEENSLWGDWFLIDRANNFAQGEPLVHIESELGWVAASVTKPINESAMAAVPIAATIPTLPTTPPTATATATKAATAVPTNVATLAATHTPAPPSHHTPTPTPTTTHNATHTPEPTSEYGIYTTLIVTNYSVEDICTLFIAPSSDPDWGSNWLGSPMGNTSQASFNINAGTYDVQALNCFDEVVKDERNVNISGVYYWDIN